jgi:hypothetical protein
LTGAADPAVDAALDRNPWEMSSGRAFQGGIGSDARVLG